MRWKIVEISHTKSLQTPQRKDVFIKNLCIFTTLRSISPLLRNHDGKYGRDDNNIRSTDTTTNTTTVYGDTTGSKGYIASVQRSSLYHIHIYKKKNYDCNSQTTFSQEHIHGSSILTYEWRKCAAELECRSIEHSSCKNTRAYVLQLDSRCSDRHLGKGWASKGTYTSNEHRPSKKTQMQAYKTDPRKELSDWPTGKLKARNFQHGSSKKHSHLEGLWRLVRSNANCRENMGTEPLSCNHCTQYLWKRTEQTNLQLKFPRTRQTN